MNTPEVFFEPSDVEKNKGMGILAYIIWFIPLIAASNSPYAKYHTNQGLILFLYFIAVFIIANILAFIPIIGWLIAFVLWVFGFVLWIIGLINSINGKAKPLPIIGKFTIIK